MELMTCKKCGQKNINKKSVKDWFIARCPVCGADLKKQLEEEKPEIIADERERQIIKKEIQDYSRRSHFYGGTGE